MAGARRFGKLVLESERRLRDTGGVEEHPGETFASRDTIQDLYEILDIKNNHGLDFQSFFDLLQRVGEEKVSHRPYAVLLACSRDTVSPTPVLTASGTAPVVGGAKSNLKAPFHPSETVAEELCRGGSQLAWLSQTPP